MLNNYLRQYLRKILGSLTTQSIKKHSIKIILVIGDYEPTLVKENIYYLLEPHTNIRRSLENSESEFSVPLSVLGSLKYPSSYIGWLRIIIKSLLRLIYLQPYKHSIILQLKYIDQEIFKYWLETLKPDLLIVSNVKHDIESLTKNLATFKLTTADADKIIDYKFPQELISKLSDVLEIDGLSANKPNYYDPYSRLRILGGKNGSVIIDSRHLYHPPKLKSIIELAQSFTGKKYVLSKIKSDIKELPIDFEEVDTINNDFITKDAVFIFRGSKDQFAQEIKQVAKTEIGL